jgi:hypothetical protein
MMVAHRSSTGFRFAGGLLLLAMLPSFAPDTWGLSCLHHAPHDGAGEHQPPETREHHAAASGHEPDAGTPSTHLAEASDHGAGHHDPQAPPCTCAGECSTSTGPPAPTRTTVCGLPPVYPEAIRVSQASSAPPAERAPYLLPFANAPPLS